MKPEAAGWRVFEGSGPWTIRFTPDRGAVVFGQALRGACKVVRDDGQALAFSPGDFLLMASPPPWEMRAMGGGPPIDFKPAAAEPALLPSVENSAALSRFMGGYFKFAAASSGLLSRLIPPIVIVRSEEVASARLGVLLTLLSQELENPRIAGAEVTKRLLEVLLVEVIRSPEAGLDARRSGLLAGLADSKISNALHLMHKEGAHDWTVGKIATAVGMSRSAFAERFAQILGSPPMDYIASWRMTLAKQTLLATNARMAEIAEMAGYRSVSAFSTAFRRTTGVSPTAYRRSAAQKE